MTNRIRVVLIHGAYGSPQENWFPWLVVKLREQGLDTYVPAFPTPEGQNLAAWKEIFDDDVGHVDDSSILVGHSLGAAFILNVLQEANQPVFGTFLVAGFVGLLGLPDFDPLNESFVDREFDWSRITRNAGHTVVYHSDDDPYVPLSRGVELAKRLSVPHEVINRAGHINAASGYLTFPKLLADILRLVNRAPIT